MRVENYGSIWGLLYPPRGAGLGPAGTTDAAVGASSVYLRTLSDPFALPAGGAPRSLTAVGSPLPLPRDQDQHRRTGEAMR